MTDHPENCDKCGRALLDENNAPYVTLDDAQIETWRILWAGERPTRLMSDLALRLVDEIIRLRSALWFYAEASDMRVAEDGGARAIKILQGEKRNERDSDADC